MDKEYKVVALVPKIHRVTGKNITEVQSAIKRNIEIYKGEIKPVLISIEEMKDGEVA